MVFKKYFFFVPFFSLGLFTSCTATKQAVLAAIIPPIVNPILTDTLPVKKSESSKTDAFLEELLKQYPQYFDSILAHRKALNVQFIYTKVDRGANGIAALKHYYFNIDTAAYFYQYHLLSVHLISAVPAG